MKTYRKSEGGYSSSFKKKSAGILALTIALCVAVTGCSSAERKIPEATTKTFQAEPVEVTTLSEDTVLFDETGTHTMSVGDEFSFSLEGIGSSEITASIQNFDSKEKMISRLEELSAAQKEAFEDIKLSEASVEFLDRNMVAATVSGTGDTSVCTVTITDDATITVTGVAVGSAIVTVTKAATTNYSAISASFGVEVISGVPDNTPDATGNIMYAVALYGIGVDQVATSDVTNTSATAAGTTTVATETAGLTFGPATGTKTVTTSVSHTPSGTTSSGNDKRCIHNDNWANIVYWNNMDPYVYEDCITNGCTKGIVLSADDMSSSQTILSTSSNTNFTYTGTGDGTNQLYYELSQVSSGDGRYENLEWNPLTEGGDSSYGTNYGGWGGSRIRAMLNGADALSLKTADSGLCSNAVSGKTYAVVNAVENYTSGNTLFDAFPEVLRNAIGARATKYDSVYNSKTEANLKTSYDKLWLLSPNEIWSTTQNTSTYYTHPLEGSQYPYFVTKTSGVTSSTSSQNGTKTYYIGSQTGGSSGTASYWWLRSSISSSSYHALYVYGTGNVSYYNAYYHIGVAPCFSLSRG